MSQKRPDKNRRGHLQAVPDEPVQKAPAYDVPDELDLIQQIDQVLSEHPAALLELSSSLVSALDPRRRDPFAPAGEEEHVSLDEFADSFIAVDLPQTTAVLHVFAALVGNELTETRIRRELARRSHPLPGWLVGLGQAETHRAVQMTDVLGDGDNIVLGTRLPGGEEFTSVVYIDHNLGTVVKDAFLIERPFDVALEAMRTLGEDPDTTFTDLDLAEARAKVEPAIERGAMTYPPLESDSWPGCRPLVEWVTRGLPVGGSGYAIREWSEHEERALLEDFFASPHGRTLDDPDHRTLLESIIWFGTGYASCDPLRWSPVRVEIILLDWLPRKIVAEPSLLALAPGLLREFVRYCHEQRSIKAARTRETLNAIRAFEAEFLRLVEGPGDDPSDASLLEALERQVGGRSALMSLSTEPLPDEPFDWSGIPDDIADRVAPVLELVDAACEELFDRELRTACRRFLARAAAGSPDIFRRTGKVETAAGAVCWVIGKANDVFSLWGGGPQVKDLLDFLGVKGGVSQRAGTMTQAAGLQDRYGGTVHGSPDLLEARRRVELIDERDRCLAALAD